METKLDTFGREPSFEGGGTLERKAVRESVGWVPRAAHLMLQSGSLVVKVMTVAVVGCMAIDLAGISSMPAVDLFLGLGRVLTVPLGSLLGLSHAGHVLGAELAALTLLVGAELSLRWGMRRV